MFTQLSIDVLPCSFADPNALRALHCAALQRRRPFLHRLVQHYPSRIFRLWPIGRDRTRFHRILHAPWVNLYSSLVQNSSFEGKDPFFRELSAWKQIYSFSHDVKIFIFNFKPSHSGSISPLLWLLFPLTHDYHSSTPFRKLYFYIFFPSKNAVHFSPTLKAQTLFIPTKDDPIPDY
jgi:hypothetical protein